MDESVFDDGASSDFAAPVKPAKAVKAKAAPKKAAAGPAKPRGRPAGAAAKPKAKAAPKKKPNDDENSDIEMDEDAPNYDDESLLVETPPKQKKAPGPKKTSGKPLADIENESFDLPEAAANKAAGGASSKYQMVSVTAAVERSIANVCAVNPFGAHHEAT
jgi:DNA topoisomerase-2